MVSTTMHLSPGAPIMKSYDLPDPAVERQRGHYPGQGENSLGFELARLDAPSHKPRCILT
jgi:hypothetical protein